MCSLEVAGKILTLILIPPTIYYLGILLVSSSKLNSCSSRRSSSESVSLNTYSEFDDRLESAISKTTSLILRDGLVGEVPSSSLTDAEDVTGSPELVCPTPLTGASSRYLSPTGEEW